MTEILKEEGSTRSGLTMENDNMRCSDHSLASGLVEPHKNQAVISTLVKVTIICAAFMLVELVGGYWANSVAVISDALHLTIDIIGYVIQITSAKLAMKSTRTFNLRKHQKDELRLLQVRTYGFSPQLFDHLAPNYLPSNREHRSNIYSTYLFQQPSHAFHIIFRSISKFSDGGCCAWMFDINTILQIPLFVQRQ